MSHSTAEVELRVLLATLGGDDVRLASPGTGDALVGEVLLQTRSDPPPGPRALVLWEDTSTEVPPGAALLVREADVAGVLERLPAEMPLLSVRGNTRWADIHDTIRTCVSSLLAQDLAGDLFDLADALAEALGGAVAIEGVDRRVLAFSTIAGQPIDEIRRRGILGRRVPEHVEREEWYQRLWRAQGPVQFSAGPESSPRLAVAVRHGDERVGTVWVVGDRTTLQPHAKRLLTEAVAGVTAALVASLGTHARSREQRNRLLLSVLTANPGPVVERLLPAVVVGVWMDGTGESQELLRTRLADILSLQAQRSEGTGLAGEVDGVVHAILPWTSESHLADQLQALLQRGGHRRVRAAVSYPVQPGGSFTAAAGEVEQLLAISPALLGDGPAVLFASACRNQLFLIGLAQALAAAGNVLSGTAARLAEYDAQHGTSYEQSLHAWFAEKGDTARAASRLHVHANTLRYRCTRAATLFDLDLEDADTRLLLHLELRLRALGYSSGS